MQALNSSLQALGIVAAVLFFAVLYFMPTFRYLFSEGGNIVANMKFTYGIFFYPLVIGLIALPWTLKRLPQEVGNIEDDEMKSPTYFAWNLGVVVTVVAFFANNELFQTYYEIATGENPAFVGWVALLSTFAVFPILGSVFYGYHLIRLTDRMAPSLEAFGQKWGLLPITGEAPAPNMQNKTEAPKGQASDFDPSRFKARGASSRHPDDAEYWAIIDDPNASESVKRATTEEIKEREAARAEQATAI